ncbi:MAG: amidohydrolase family protein, partial [Actinomycetota bacterium]
IQDGVIVEVGRGLDGDSSVDLTGSWLLPGMIDCHVHVTVSTINFLQIVQTPFSLQFYLAAENLSKTLLSGVTSIRDAGGADLGIKRAVESGLIRGPRMKISIIMLSQTGGHGDSWFSSGSHLQLFVPHPGRPSGLCDGPQEIVRKVREVIRAGADVIKICTTGGVLSPEDEPTSSQFLPDEIELIVAEARASGLEVMSHAQGTNGIKNALKAGVRSIEHGIYLDDEAIDLMLDQGAYLVPTLIAPPGVLEVPEGIPEASLRKAREVIEVHRSSIGRAYEAGVKIAMGTDSGVTAHGRNLEELIHLVEVGMSPMDAIVASTRVAAENLGIGSSTGTVEPGKSADLIALGSDPLADIKVFADPGNVTGVWLGGERVKG